MDISVNARHVQYNDEIKNIAQTAIQEAFCDFRLKISSVNMVLDFQKNQTKATITVAIKDAPVHAASESHENISKAISGAIDKAVTQTRKYLDKKQDHKKISSLAEQEILIEERQNDDENL